ncbi:hypothetical protein VPHD239_0177 [Vibrio phage D239]
MKYQNRTLTEFIVRAIVHIGLFYCWYIVTPVIYTTLGSYIVVGVALGGLLIWHTQQAINFMDEMFDTLYKILSHD